MTTTLRPVQLYRQLLQVARKWPEDQERMQSVKKHILETIMVEFRRPVPLQSEPQVWMQQRMEMGRNQLEALTLIVENQLEEKYGPSSDSPLRAFLPAPKMFSLLNTDSQKQMQSKKVNFFNVFFQKEESPQIKL